MQDVNPHLPVFCQWTSDNGTHALSLFRLVDPHGEYLLEVSLAMGQMTSVRLASHEEARVFGENRLRSDDDTSHLLQSPRPAWPELCVRCRLSASLTMKTFLGSEYIATAMPPNTNLVIHLIYHCFSEICRNRLEVPYTRKEKEKPFYYDK